MGVLRARQKLGKFRIKQRISDGPLAAVYQARDTIQDQDVALKVPHPSAMTEFFLADFKRSLMLFIEVRFAMGVSMLIILILLVFKNKENCS